MDYRPDIDGLRALAVLAVVVFHAAPGTLPGGFVGVDIFFVISGFLITGFIRDDLARGRFSMASFYARRIRRLFPALAVVLCFTLIAGWIELYAGEFEELGRQVASAATFTSNFLFLSEAGYFDRSAATKPLLHLWSLAVEEQFYLIWPALVLVAFKRSVPIRYVAIIVCLTSLGLCLWVSRFDPTQAFYSPLTRFWELMLGATLATKLLASLLVRNVLSIVGTALIIVSMSVTRDTQFPGLIALLPTVGTAAIIMAGQDTATNRMLSLRPMVLIGLISYPLYLWHWPLIVFLKIASFDRPPAGYVVITVALAFLLATITWFAIERPLRAWSFAPIPLSILAALLGLGGALVFRLGGMPSRSAVDYAGIFKNARPLNHGVSDGSCKQFFSEPILKNEVCVSQSERPEILIIGDSHAMALNSAAPLLHLNTLLMAGSSCPPLQGFQLHGENEPAENRNCDLIVERAIAAAHRLASLKTVVLASMGPTYFADQGYGIYRNGKGAADPAADFREGYLATVRALLARGLHVILLIDVPELGFDPTACTARRIALIEAPQCVLSRQAHDARQLRYRELISAIKMEAPEISVLDTTPLFCDPIECRWHSAAHALYFDQHHVSPDGAAIILEQIGRLTHVKD